MSATQLVPRPPAGSCTALVAATSFLVLLIVAFATRQPVFLAIYSVVALALVLANVRPISRMGRRESSMVGLVVASLTLMLPIAALRNESALAHYLAILTSLGAAYVLTRRMGIYLAASRWSLIAAQASVALFLAFTGLENFPLEDMLPDSSSNGVTSYLVLLQANYCIVHYAFRRRTSLVTSSITLAICVVGFGRGSLLASAAILALNLVFTPWVKTRGQAIVAIATAAVTAYALISPLQDQIVDFIELNTKIGVGLEDEPRERIIRDYLNRIDAWHLVVGADYRGTAIEDDYFGNPHNSYIRAHHLFGLPYLLTMVLLPLFILRGDLAVSVKVFSVLIGLVILFRSFTEPILFPTLFDFYWFAICFALATPWPKWPARTAQ